MKAPETLGTLDQRGVVNLTKPTRLDRINARMDTQLKHRRDEQIAKTAVWIRDEHKDRYTGQHVRRRSEFAPDRGEVHHVEPRANKVTRWDPRNLLLLSLVTHARFKAGTLKVNGTKFFTASDGQRYIDCDYPVTFIEVTL